MTHTLSTGGYGDLKRYYIRKEIVPFEEDSLHEFKAHRNLCVEEIPPWTVTPDSDRRTRAPVSRAINGFLNSGEGGTIYLGIVDSGEVKGLNLSLYQMDHIRASLTDLMTRYSPPVEPHRWRVQFVPVIDPDTPEDDIRNIMNYDHRKYINAERRNTEHILRTNRLCWCVKESMALYNVGVMSQDYIAEIIMSPWDPDHPDNKHAVGEMRAPPVHEDEIHKAYFRRQASCMPVPTDGDFILLSSDRNSLWQYILISMKCTSCPSREHRYTTRINLNG